MLIMHDETVVMAGGQPAGYLLFSDNELMIYEGMRGEIRILSNREALQNLNFASFCNHGLVGKCGVFPAVLHD
ncbi:hypothetical protein N231_12340 [Geobacillus stearothermophilus ATCC 12980]|nr:hypothetical protein [Geobacillus stearothermophilus]KOR92875.1 hypothetical protein N231_12340 [Geobacillus stearothermophilus ATCC 12980]PJW14119.1 hypothetical protein CV945_10075 [Geobacillus sp. Manikaran-105]KFL16882.1 hypothetical protein ET31_03750 [Geobacillus stearothermophilus]KFX33864.1 hypothetical protein GT94_10395 [Geobacillus stearothermophilus]KMY57641.1 hypothetical protein AA906_13305 [Geobacillus stearothermophilus]